MVINKTTVVGGSVITTPPAPSPCPTAPSATPHVAPLPTFEDTCYKLTGWTWAECREDHVKWARVNPDVRAHLFALWSLLVKEKVAALPPAGPVVYCQPEYDLHD
jgi:hypothetical protein